MGVFGRFLKIFLSENLFCGFYTCGGIAVIFLSKEKRVKVIWTFTSAITRDSQESPREN